MMRYSQFLKTIFKPYMDNRIKREVSSYSKLADSDYIKSLKNSNEGKRCFIVGNGPSLTGDDLTLIKDEISFGCNRIYNIFNKTEWRPDYYMVVDQLVVAEEIANIKKLRGPHKFISYRAKRYGREDKDEIHYIVLYKEFSPDNTKNMIAQISEDVSKYFTWSNTVLINQIELAIYMGFKEIYLIGVDHNYPISIDKYGNKKIDETIKSHFDNGGSKEKSRNYIYIDAATNDYEVCKKYADEHGIRIYNATRGGKLEVFDRVNLEDII